MAAAAAATEADRTAEFSRAAWAATEFAVSSLEATLAAQYLEVLLQAGEEAATQYAVDALALRAAGGYVESEHPRDPGGEGGGRWIEKDASAADDPMDEWEAIRVPYHERGITLYRGIKVPVPSQFDMIQDATPERVRFYIENDVLTDWSLGIHWSTDEEVAKAFARPQVTGGMPVYGVVYEAKVLPEDIIPQSDYRKYSEHTVFGLREGGESELPVRPGAPVLITGITKYLADGEVLVKDAEATQMIVTIGDPRLDADPTFAAAGNRERAAVGHLVNEEEMERQAAVRTRRTRQLAVALVTDAALESVGVSFDVAPGIVESVLDKVGVRADYLGAAARDAVSRAVTEGLAEGWSVPQTAAAIRLSVAEASPARATALARTDLVGLANASSMESARLAFAGERVFKRWWTAHDERVRPTHVAANGQTVPMEAPFSVGDSLLQYPGDQDGPDEEVIQCRCVPLYVTKRDAPMPVLASAAWEPDDPLMAEMIEHMTRAVENPGTALAIVPGIPVTAEQAAAIRAAYVESEHPRDPGGEGGGRWVPKGGAEGPRTQAGDRLLTRLAADTPENVKALWETDPRDAVATILDLSNAPTQATIEAAKRAAIQESRAWFEARYPDGVTVYRGGPSEFGEPLVAWTPNRSTALFFARKDPALVRERFVRAADVVVALRAINPGGRGFAGEDEVWLARTEALTAAFDPAKHPRHPAGSEAGGEWAPKGVRLARVRQDEIDRTASLRRERGQGTRHTRTTEPVKGPDGEWLPGHRDAMLIQADEFFTTLPAEQQATIAQLTRFDERAKLEIYDKLTRDRMVELTSVESGAEVAVRVPAEAVESILEEGRLLNAHDVGHRATDRTSKDTYLTSRAEAERAVWSIDSDDPEAHPIYGYVATPNEKLDVSIARGFGDVKLALDDAVRPRTTVTYSDSMFAGIGGGDLVPSPIDQPSELSVASWMNLGGVEVPVAYKGQERLPEPTLPAAEEERLSRFYEEGRDAERREVLDRMGYRPWRHGDFIEAQIHGGVSVRDIRRVDFEQEPTESVLRRLDALGIPWTIGGPS